MPFLHTHPRGIALFLIVLILGMTATATILLLSQTSLHGRLQIEEQIRTQAVRTELFGCLDEVLAHFPANPNYNPTTVDLATYTCTATVQTNGNQRTVTLSRSNQNITRRLVAVVNVNITPITVSSVVEQ
jgi:hypothetical protein